MQRFADFTKMIGERRLGFLIDEQMIGTHEFEPGCGPRGRFPFEFRVSWGPKHLLAWANPLGPGFLEQPLRGTVTAGELCERAPCEGTFALRYFTTRSIRYAFRFAVAETQYEYVGEKVNILPWNLPVSHTTCFGTLKETQTGKLVSRSVTFFKLRTMPAFLASSRLA
ncbi:MAG: hypothetical protein HY744_27715 [Deltaproteobacteria bacterium]|nr:hypothetical protein [Deltaproteobacteria bacterium]